MVYNDIKNVYTPLRRPTEGDLVLLNGGGFMVLLGEKLYDRQGIAGGLTDAACSYGYVVPRSVVDDPTTPEHKIKREIVKAVDERRATAEAKQRALTTANKAGHCYTMRDGTRYLCLGHGALTKLAGTDALSTRGGYVYVRLDESSDLGNDFGVRDTKRAFADNVIVVDPATIKLNIHARHGLSYLDGRWQIAITKNPKRGFDAGQLLTVGQSVHVVLGTDEVDADPYGNPNEISGTLGYGDDPLFMFTSA